MCSSSTHGDIEFNSYDPSVPPTERGHPMQYTPIKYTAVMGMAMKSLSVDVADVEKVNAHSLSCCEGTSGTVKFPPRKETRRLPRMCRHTSSCAMRPSGFLRRAQEVAAWLALGR